MKHLATIAVALMAVAIVATEWVPSASAVSPVKGKSKVATCVVPAANGESTKWFARYQVTGSTRAPEIRLVRTGEESHSPAAPEGTLRPWVVTWAAPHHRPSTVRKRAADIGSATFSAEKLQMLSPDGNCILYLSAVPTPPHKVAVIGDSVFANIAQTVVKKALGGESYAQSWQISATSGNGWNATPISWPLKVVDGHWAIDSARGLAASHPSALVVELGADDALRAVFASALSDPTRAAEVVNGVSANIGEFLDQESSVIPCTVLVTAPSVETPIFGAGEIYVTEADLVNSVIRTQALQHTNANVRVADWAVVSASHHSPSGPRKDWFTSGDNVHPNVAGQEALISLIHHVIGTCTK
jgi:GDSL-like Lipase/Acylhydrolase